MKVRKKYQRKQQHKQGLKLVIALIVILWAAVVGINQLNRLSSSSSDEAAAKATATTAKSHQEFIDSLVPKAQELHATYGVLPSVIIAQAILESDWGNSTLASKYHNLFGIKAGENQDKVHLETQEFVNDEWVTVTADFRVFASNAAALEAHSLLFVNGTTWNPKQYEAVLLAADYKAAATALQTSGYATDPGYAQKIIEIIETSKLTQYDSFTSSSGTSSSSTAG